MSLHKTFVSKYKGRPVLLLVAAVGFTFSFYGFYNLAYKPWSRRKMFKDAEQYANLIFEKENERRNI